MGNSKSFHSNVLGADGNIAKSIFDFNVPSSTGEEISMSTLRGKNAYLVVNVASS